MEVEGIDFNELTVVELDALLSHWPLFAAVPGLFPTSERLLISKFVGGLFVVVEILDVSLLTTVAAFRVEKGLLKII